MHDSGAPTEPVPLVASLWLHHCALQGVTAEVAKRAGHVTVEPGVHALIVAHCAFGSKLKRLPDSKAVGVLRNIRRSQPFSNVLWRCDTSASLAHVLTDLGQRAHRNTVCITGMQASRLCFTLALGKEDTNGSITLLCVSMQAKPPRGMDFTSSWCKSDAF